MIKKYSLVFIALLCSFFYGFGQGSETFTNVDAPAGNYGNGSYTGDNALTWSYNGARTVTATYNITGTSIGFGTSGTRNVSATSDVNGVGDLTYSISRYFTGGTAAQRSIEVYVNGNLYDSYTLAAEGPVYTRNFTANETGAVIIEFRSTGSRQIVIDDVSWTAASAGGCSITTSGVANISCNDNSTSGDASDDYITFDLDPAGSTLGTNYTVSVSSGSITPTTAVYGSATTFTLQNGSAGLGDVTVTITDDTDGSCTLDQLITDPGSCASGSCTELMISEYVEGSSNNKYIEIYNPTASIVNLTGYSLVLFANGTTTPTSTEDLSGSIAGYGTVVYANSSAAAYIGTTITSAVCNFNGDDAIALFNGANYIDIIGSVGHDPGSAWTADGGYSTQNKTLRRKSTIQNGITINPATGFPTLVSEWDLLNIDDVSDLGNHTSDCQASTPEIQLVDNTATNQNCGFTIDFGTQALSSNTDLTFDIENVGSADLDISSFGITGDYTIVSPTAPLTITSGNSQTVTVRFTPTANGTRNGVLTINNNDSNEGSCTVNLTGVGFTPAPEIDVERNTGGSIPSGAAANIGYNTIFATTTIGNTTAPKPYHIANEGTANLSLTSITSSNPAEFSISLNPAPITINPSTEIDFEIIFSPTGIGLRTATITIVSNDADENPYTFNVQGNGDCASGTLTFLPDNGPVGTIVNVTSSTSNFGGSTTASIGGIPASVTVIAANEIEVTIPTGASTGSLEINDDLGCLSSGLFTIIDELISGCEGSSGLTPTDLFITEVTDKGTGSHSYVEVYNGTGAAISLNTYELRIHNNGATTATTTIPLSGTIANQGIIVVAFGGSNANDPEGGYTADFFSGGGGGINEDDHIRLYDGTNWVDLWGDTSGNPFTIASKDYTYRRKNSGITAPSTTWNINDWEEFTPVDYSDIGIFDFSLGVPPTVTLQPIANNTNCDTSIDLVVVGSQGFSGGLGLAYRWFFHAPGDATWTEIMSDGGPYTGFNQATLNVSFSDVIDVNGYQYYCQVRENSATCYTASNAVKLNHERAFWDSNTWSSSPDINKLVVINDDYNTNAQTSFETCNLIVNAGSTLTVANTYYVEVENNVVVKGNLNVQSQGSFIQNDNAGTFTHSGTGTSQVTKLTAPLATLYTYTYWSSPVKDALIGTALFTTNPNRRYYFEASNFLDEHTDETTNGTPDDIDDNGDDWQLAVATNIMEVGRGYASTHTNIGFVSGNSYGYIFPGEFNTGTILEPLSNNPANTANHWNLVGNPYPSAINVNDPVNGLFAINAGIIKPEIYMWSQYQAPLAENPGNQNLNFNQDDYVTINNTGPVGNGSDMDGDGDVDAFDVPEEYIPSGQSFFVSSLAANDLTFTNAMRISGGNSNTQFFEPNNSAQDKDDYSSYTLPERLWLNLISDNGAANQLLVGYNNQASNDYDLGYDTKRNLSANSSTIIYTMINDSPEEKFVIQGKNINSINVNEIIPVGFKTTINVPTIFTFSLIKFEGSFLTQNDIFIKDNLLNKTHNLKTSDYSFTSEVGEFNDRFEIVFTEAALSLGEVKIDSNTLQIIELQNGDVQFKVSSQFEMKSIEIVDLLGRTLYKLEAQGNSQTFSLSNLSQATYLAKVELSNDYVITKKALKRK